MFTIHVNGIEAAIAGLQRFNPNQIRARLRRAVRATLRAGKQELKSRVTERYTAKSPMSLGSTATRVGDLTGSLKVGGARNQLRKFIIRPSSRQRKPPPGGVFASVVRGSGGAIHRAFLQRSGGVYERTGASRFPIRQLKTVSLPGMAKAVGEQVISRMGTVLGNEINAALGGL